jgi:hypothetical protein
LTKCAPNKDFGKGFYVTKFREQAESFAKIIGEKNDTEGIVTEFDYTESSFAESICNIKKFDGYSEEWLDFIDDSNDISIEIAEISKKIIERLIVDFNYEEETATDLFYNSNTFTQLSDEPTKLYLKNWQEIYELLKTEMSK